MRRSPVHVAARVWAFGVAGLQVRVEIGLHLLEPIIPLLATHDAEVLVEHGPVEAFDEPVAPWPTHPSCRVPDVLELQEDPVEMRVGAATERAAVVREYGGHASAVCVEGRHNGIVERVNRGNRERGCVQARAQA